MAFFDKLKKTARAILSPKPRYVPKHSKTRSPEPQSEPITTPETFNVFQDKSTLNAPATLSPLDSSDYDTLEEYATDQWKMFVSLHPEAAYDEEAQEQFDLLYKYPNEVEWGKGEYDRLYDEFSHHILEKYGLIFDRQFWDWEDFRDFYDELYG